MRTTLPSEFLKDWADFLWISSVQRWCKFITFSPKISKKQSHSHCFSTLVVHILAKNSHLFVFPLFTLKNGCYTNSKFWQKFGRKEFSYNLNTIINCLSSDHKIFPNIIQAFFVNFSIFPQHWTALIHRKSRLISSERALISAGILTMLWIIT